MILVWPSQAPADARRIRLPDRQLRPATRSAARVGPDLQVRHHRTSMASSVRYLSTCSRLLNASVHTSVRAPGSGSCADAAAASSIAALLVTSIHVLLSSARDSSSS